MQRVPRVPAWVTVLATAAVVGSISAMVSVAALARVRNSESVSEMPVPSEVHE
jgi:hypothetical protein